MSELAADPVTVDRNNTLVRIGPGTQTGELFRRYWLPVCLSTDIPDPDGDPLPVELLGERLVVWRDSNGAVGVLREACPHRGASLALGRVEHCGIRCLYHGWKLDVDGVVVDAPNVRASAAGTGRLRGRAFAACEVGGLLWVYPGDPAQLPDFPHYAYMDLPPEQYTVVTAVLDCNWLQVLEGSLDSSHLGVLHADYSPLRSGEGQYGVLFHEDPDFGSDDNCPKLEIARTDFGLHYAALREPDDGDDTTHVRIAPYVLPSTVMIAGGFIVVDVPLTDTSTMFVLIHYSLDGPVDPAGPRAMLGLDRPDVYHGARSRQSRANRFLQDRSALTRSFTGLPAVTLEDFAITLSMGPIVDRDLESLVPADRAIIESRRLILDAGATVAAGGDPPGVRFGTPPRLIRAAEAAISRDTPWTDLVADHRPADRRRVVAATGG